MKEKNIKKDRSIQKKKDIKTHRLKDRETQTEIQQTDKKEKQRRRKNIKKDRSIQKKKDIEKHTKTQRPRGRLTEIQQKSEQTR